MSQAKAPAPAKPQPKRPHKEMVCAGQPVLWYPDGNTRARPSPAVVEYVGEMTVSLQVFQEGSPYSKYIDGVFHVDQKVGEQVRMDTGGWDHTDATIRLYRKAPELALWPEDLRKPIEPPPGPQGPQTDTKAS